MINDRSMNTDLMKNLDEDLEFNPDCTETMWTLRPIHIITEIKHCTCWFSTVEHVPIQPSPLPTVAGINEHPSCYQALYANPADPRFTLYRVIHHNMTVYKTKTYDLTPPSPHGISEAFCTRSALNWPYCLLSPSNSFKFLFIRMINNPFALKDLYILLLLRNE